MHTQLKVYLTIGYRVAIANHNLTFKDFSNILIKPFLLTILLVNPAAITASIVPEASM